ncbi:MAG: hypothetical protein EPN97_08820 [Alphaproteobacteria bacterium]|nr:MAG: hypothetical protein EPN97_08820 [Alphaproteobacteria bacterium]
MAKPAPKKSAKRVPNLKFDFNAAVRRARKDHPELAKNALFIDAQKADWEETADILASVGVDEDDLDDLKKTVRDAKRLKTSFHLALNREDAPPLSAVVFHADRHPLYGDKNGPIDDAGTFDHETGHALTPEMEGTLAENTADAYAALRHLQRTGGEGKSIDYCGWKRAFIFMTTGAISHLTTFTIDQIICDAKAADFMSMTPEETAAVAKAYAAMHTPEKKELTRLRAAFRPLRKLPPQKALKKLARMTLKAPEDSQEFYLGARVLAGALKEGGVTVDGQDIVLKGSEWNDIQRALDKKTANLPPKHPLRRHLKG